MDLESLIRLYIRDIYHLSLATCSENIPWITEVHFVYDEDLNFYILSRPERRHSREIAMNSRVSGNIVRQFSPGEKVTGIYFEGNAQVLEKVIEYDTAFLKYQERFGITPIILEEQNEENGHRFYRINVEKFFAYDEKYLDIPGKYELNWKIGA